MLKKLKNARNTTIIDETTTYFFYDNLFYELNAIDENGKEIIKITDSFDNIKENSNVIYIPNNFEIINKEKELFQYIKENYPLEEDMEGKIVHLSKFNEKFYVSEYNEKLLKNLNIIKQKNIQINNIIDYLDKIYTTTKKNLIKNENLSYNYLIPFFKYNENYYLTFLAEYRNNDYVLKKIEFFDENEILNEISNTIFSEQRNDKILILYTTNEIKKTDNIYKNLKEQFKIDKYIEYFENKKTLLENLNKKIGDELIIYKLKIDKEFFTKRIVKSNKINLLKYYNNIKRQTNIKYGIILGVAAAFGGINYYINTIMTQNVIDNFNNQISMLKMQYKNLINKEKEEEANRIHSIIVKKFSKADKEFLTLPYLITYLTHFKLKIISAELLFSEKQVKYYGIITVQGMLPKELLVNFNKTIGLKGLDIIPSKDVMKNGFTYVLMFDMSKVYKILHKKGLINVKNF